jgi:hypothetical protein
VYPRSTVVICGSTEARSRVTRAPFAIRSAGSGVELGATKGAVVTGNRFTHNDTGLTAEVAVEGLNATADTFSANAVAGILLTASFYGPAVTTISRNVLHRNGFNAGGRLDPRGTPIADGIHVTSPAGAPVTIEANVTNYNAAERISDRRSRQVYQPGRAGTCDPCPDPPRR